MSAEPRRTRGSTRIERVLSRLRAIGEKAKWAHGAHNIFVASSEGLHVPAAVSTGIPVLDYMIHGVPPHGVPAGRITEIFSQREAEGKSWLAESILAEAQRAGAVTAVFDTEGFNMERAQAQGVDLDDLLIGLPADMSEVFDEAVAIIGIAGDDLVVLDWNSLAATTPPFEEHASVARPGFGTQQAMAVSRGLCRIAGDIRRSKAVLLVENQTRSTMSLYGDKDRTVGGRALPFYASVRLRVRKIGDALDAQDRRVGIKCRVAVVKDKLSPAGGEVEYVAYTDGPMRGRIDGHSATLDYLERRGEIVFAKNGRAAVGDVKLTRATFREKMIAAPEVYESLLARCLALVQGSVPRDAPEDDGA